MAGKFKSSLVSATCSVTCQSKKTTDVSSGCKQPCLGRRCHSWSFPFLTAIGKAHHNSHVLAGVRAREICLLYYRTKIALFFFFFLQRIETRAYKHLLVAFGGLVRMRQLLSAKGMAFVQLIPLRSFCITHRGPSRPVHLESLFPCILPHVCS